jgi:diketogulonate reductase-like aldo/keto reductase
MDHSKLWNDKHAEEDVIPAFEKSLQDLQLDYLDLPDPLALSEFPCARVRRYLQKPGCETLHS